MHESGEFDEDDALHIDLADMTGEFEDGMLNFKFIIDIARKCNQKINDLDILEAKMEIREKELVEEKKELEEVAIAKKELDKVKDALKEKQDKLAAIEKLVAMKDDELKNHLKEEVNKQNEYRLKELDDRQAKLDELEKGIEKQEEMRQKMAEKIKAMEETEKRIIEKEKELNAADDILHDYEVKYMDNYYKTSENITLNVGGHTFPITKALLMKFPGSLFEAIVLTGRALEDDEVFIDRDPKYFGAVYNYMREHHIRPKDKTSVDIKALQDEFAFYQIDVDEAEFKN